MLFSRCGSAYPKQVGHFFEVNMAETPKSVIVESIVAWAKNLVTALLPALDARALVLMVGAGVAAWFSVDKTAEPLLKTAGSFGLWILVILGVVHLARKIVLSKKFDLTEHSDQAKAGNIASAIVFASVMFFVTGIAAASIIAVISR
jgi:hypothetical protein